MGAARVFPGADCAGEIAGVDVAKAGLAGDFDGLQKIVGGGVARGGHFVIAVEGSDVPGDVGRNSGEEFGEAAEFVGRVIEAGDEEGDDFEPQAHSVDAANTFEDRGDAAAEFVIVTVVEAFEIDFVKIEPRAQVFEDLRRSVAVGDEAGDESGGFGWFENGYGPFAGDERLVVGADENLCALGERILHKVLWRGRVWRRDGVGIAQGLRSHPVLTVGAVKIAAQHSEAVGEGAGMGVEERLLLHGIALGSGGVSPGDIEGAAAVVADFADSGLAFGDGAAVSAGEAAEAVVAELFDKGGVGFADALVEDGAEGGHGGPGFILALNASGAEALVLVGR